MGDAAAAHIAAARLASEGIASRVRGESLGPYPVTVGSLAVTQIWIPHSRMADARVVMLAGEVDAAFGDPESDDVGGRRDWLVWSVVAAALLAMVVARLALWIL